ncbi:DUF3667 domain-containing protein [Marinoscillum sp.]|uniref:DUF3667 domain-containing protein n=1 Tax=Marinoscillum sp. TaxID=2024838 RepID=UPI003BAD6DDF
MGHEHTCLSCGNHFTGNFCNQCGEKIIHQSDRKFSRFIVDLINALTFADTKLWRSLKSILLNPGKMAHDCAIGRRVPYMKPISLFFLANFIYFLLPAFNTFGTQLRIQLHSGNNLHTQLANRMVEKEVADSWVSYEEYEARYNAKTMEMSKLLLILMVFMISLLVWPLHLGVRRNLFADQLIFALELMTYIIVYGIQLFGILVFLLAQVGFGVLGSEPYSSLALMGFLTYFIFRAEKSLYGIMGWQRWLNTILVIVAIILSLFLYRMLLFFVTFWSL